MATMVIRGRVPVTLLKTRSTLTPSRAYHQLPHISSTSTRKSFGLNSINNDSYNRHSASSWRSFTLTHSRSYAQNLTFEQREAAAKAKLCPSNPSPSSFTRSQPQPQSQYYSPPPPPAPDAKPRKTLRLVLTTLAVIYIASYASIYYTWRSSQMAAPLTGRKRFIDDEEKQHMETEAKGEMLNMLVNEEPALLGDQDEMVRDARAVVGRLVATGVVRGLGEEGVKRAGVGSGSAGMMAMGLPWTVAVLDLPYAPFSKAMAANTIQISTGLLSHFTTEPRLAASLAVLISRQVCQHKLENRSHKALLTSLTYPITPLLSTATLVLDIFGIPALLASIAQLRYYKRKRQQCYEADTVALRMLWEAGYDVNELVKFYEESEGRKQLHMRRMREKLMTMGIIWAPPNEDELSRPDPINRARKVEEQIPTLMQQDPEKKTWLLGSVAGRPMRYGMVVRGKVGPVDEEGKKVVGDEED